MTIATFVKSVLVGCSAVVTVCALAHLETQRRELPAPVQQILPFTPAEPAADAPVQTVVVSAKRLSPLEKVRYDEIEAYLATQHPAPHRKAARMLT